MKYRRFKKRENTTLLKQSGFPILFFQLSSWQQTQVMVTKYSTQFLRTEEFPECGTIRVKTRVIPPVQDGFSTWYPGHSSSVLLAKHRVLKARHWSEVGSRGQNQKAKQQVESGQTHVSQGTEAAVFGQGPVLLWKHLFTYNAEIKAPQCT